MTGVAPPAPLEDAAALARAGRFDEAEALARRQLARDPEDADALNLLGSVARARGDRARAAEYYAEALRCRPDFAKAHGNLGAVLLEEGRARDAIEHLSAALMVAPDFTDARLNLGTALLNLGESAAAERELRALLAATPDDGLALNSLGNALFHLGRVDEAIAAFERALARDPSLAMALNNLATAWREKGEHVKAEQALRRALALAPDFAEAWSALGVVRRERGDVAEARAAQERALAIKPALASARFSHAIIALGDGRFAEGFRDYLARPLAGADRMFRGELPDDLSGQTVLLLPNQGLGDELFFLRFAPLLKRRGATLVYRAASAIRSIVRRSGVVDRVLTEDDPEPAHDLAISIGDLPFGLGVRSSGDLPPPLPLPADEPGSADAAATLARLGPPPYIGVTWRAGTPGWNTLRKTVPAAALGRALAGLPGTVLALQRAPDPGEIAALSDAVGGPVHDLTALNGNLDAMLALLHRIDAYVTVSNTNLHLRAGTGRICHVLVPHPPEWRWMNAGDRSPWFADFSVYRQQPTETAGGGWEEALAAVRNDLSTFLRAGSPGMARQ